MSAGEDAQGQVLVRCRRSSDEGPGALVVSGHGLSTNIIEASLDGYLVAVNKLHGAEINGVDVAFVGAADGRGPAVRRASPRYRIATIPGDGVGPEVVAAARRVARRGAAARSASPSSWPEHPRRRRRDRRVRRRDPARGRRGRAGPPTRSCSARSAGRSGTTPSRRVRPGAGAVRAPRRARAVREPAAGHASTRR